MKSILKPLFLSTAISTLAVCFTLSHAATISTIDNDSRSSIIVMTQVFPVTNNQAIKKSQSFMKVFDKPLVRIPIETPLIEQFKPASKKNNFFELATVFNDKLQQFIADIDLPIYENRYNNNELRHTSGKKTCKS